MHSTETRLIKPDTYFSNNMYGYAIEPITLGFYPKWVIIDNMTEVFCYLYDSTAVNPVETGLTPLDVIPPHSFKVIPTLVDRQNWTVSFAVPTNGRATVIRATFTDDPIQATAIHISDRNLAYGSAYYQNEIGGGTVLVGAEKTIMDIRESITIERILIRTFSKTLHFALLGYQRPGGVFNVNAFPVATGDNYVTPERLYVLMNARSYPWEVMKYDTANNEYMVEAGWARPIQMPNGMKIVLQNLDATDQAYYLTVTYRYM